MAQPPCRCRKLREKARKLCKCLRSQNNKSARTPTPEIKNASTTCSQNTRVCVGFVFGLPAWKRTKLRPRRHSTKRLFIEEVTRAASDYDRVHDRMQPQLFAFWPSNSLNMQTPRRKPSRKLLTSTNAFGTPRMSKACLPYYASLPTPCLASK